MKYPNIKLPSGWVFKDNRTLMNKKYPDQKIIKTPWGWVHLKLNFERDYPDVVKWLTTRADLKTYLASLA